MSFVSYAQNFEDVVLWRALRDVRDGRYMDIGAQEPELDSVSLAFYKAGWRGVHVEPTPGYAARLREARADETVIEAAVTDAPGPIRFFELGGLSSGREDVAEHHRGNGHEPREILVPTVRLDHLLSLIEGDLHWLKIDVEGMEADVLRSWGTSKSRPWILVIESTFPNSAETTEHLWIQEVLSRGYEEAFFDGLSRYFVHEAHPELSARLNRPANVFDDFQITSRHFAALLTREEAEKQHKASEARIAALKLDILQLRDRLHDREAQAERDRAAHAREKAASDQEITELQALLRAKESQVAAEQAQYGQLEKREQDLAAELAKREEELGAQRETTAVLNSELLQILNFAGVDSNDPAHPRGVEARVSTGSAYAAVRARLTLAREELLDAREHAVQQFVGGQKSRDSEVDFLAERVSALQHEITQAHNRIRGAEGKSAQAEADRRSLQSEISEKSAALERLQSDAAKLEQQLSEVRQSVSSLYASRRGKLAVWLNLLPRRAPDPSLPASSQSVPRAEQIETKQASATPRPTETDNRVNDIRHTSNLLALNGSAFVEALYRTFLKRSPDRAGRDHFIGRLQSGDPKEAILLAVAASPEARATGVNIDGLAELRRSQSRARRWSPFNRNARALEARLGRLEYSIGEAHNSVADRLARMESSLEQIQSKFGNVAGRHLTEAREAGVYVQGVPVSLKRGVTMRPTDGAAEFIGELRNSVQSSLEAQSLRNGR